MTDSDWLLSVLRERPGEWFGQTEIMTRSVHERGHGLTVHSRAATLRERGLIVQCKIERRQDGRVVSFYRLLERVSLPSPTGDLESLSSGGPVGDGSDTGSSPEDRVSSPQAGGPPAAAVPATAGGQLPLIEEPARRSAPAWS